MLTQCDYNVYMEKKTERNYSIRMSPELLQELRQLAKEDKRSMNSEMVWILQNYVELRRKERKQEVAPNT